MLYDGSGVIKDIMKVGIEDITTPIYEMFTNTDSDLADINTLEELISKLRALYLDKKNLLESPTFPDKNLADIDANVKGVERAIGYKLNMVNQDVFEDWQRDVMSKLMIKLNEIIDLIKTHRHDNTVALSGKAEW